MIKGRTFAIRPFTFPSFLIIIRALFPKFVLDYGTFWRLKVLATSIQDGDASTQTSVRPDD